MQDLFAALALVLVLEGIMPFLAPSRYRDAVRKISELDDSMLRKVGLASMIAGLVMLLIVRS
ncbi:MAG: DUF2065 domain-containing protein [Sedimenticolaceae bacterium]|nr:DUF2065 domain-containing protein [Sedimenticolaceae bacterium]